MNTPRTNELLQRIMARDGQVGVVLGNAPEEWVTLARELEAELEALKKELAYPACACASLQNL